MKNNKKRTLKVTEIIDKNTGEIEGEKISSISYDREPDFVKMYIEDLGKILGLSGTTNSVLLSLLSKMNYDGEVLMNALIKKAVAERSKCKIDTVQHAITTLCEQNIFIKKANNYYLVNPHYFARGKWEDIRQIRMTISYDKNGRAVQKTEFDGQTVLPFTEEAL